MERETKTITTPKNQYQVEIKTYLTGREKREIANASFPTTVDYSTSTEGIRNISLAEMTNRGEDTTIRTIVVAINGQKEPEIDFVKTILDMHSADSDFILGQIKMTAQGLGEEKKTT